jgi:AcrR family transcriptional regulator
MIWTVSSIDLDDVHIMCNSVGNGNAATSFKVNAGSYHHGDLRRVLIACALELAAEAKDWNFTLRAVARRAGVSHNAPYNHFAHKRELLAAAAAAGQDMLRSELVTAVAEVTDPGVALLRMGTVYISFGMGHPALYRLMFSAALGGPDWHPEKVLAEGVATRALLEDIIRRGAHTGFFDPALTRKSGLQVATLHVWAAVHGLTMLAIDGLAKVGDISSECIGQRVLTTISRSLEAGR